MKNQRKRKRRKTARAMTVGIRLGLLVFTAYLTVRLCIAGIETLEARAGAPGGEIFILPLIVLLVWSGWIARKEYTALKEGGTKQHEYRASESIPDGGQR